MASEAERDVDWLLWLEQNLLRAAAWWDERRWPSLLLIVACFLPLAFLEARVTPLINDEIYTLHIAQQPTLRDMLALAREIDLHPPLHYLAVREAMHLHGPVRIVARLPSILANLVLAYALFGFVARRFGRLFGTFAVACAWLTPLLDLSWTDRPYTLWLAFLWLLILAWDRRQSRREGAWLGVVFTLAAATVATHLLGILCIGVIVFAEMVRWIRERQTPDWPGLAFLLLPCLGGIWLRFQFHELGKNVFPPDQLASASLLWATYDYIGVNLFLVVVGCVFGATLLFGLRRPPKEERFPVRWSSADGALVLGFVLLPLVIFVPAVLLHMQFWWRYGAATMPALGALMAWLVATRLPHARVTALIVVAATVGFLCNRMVSESGPQDNRGEANYGRPYVRLANLEQNVPIVAASPMTFVEMADREPPAVADRVFYLTDYDAAYKYAHYTLFENEDKIARLLNLPSHAVPLKTFVGAHTRFYVAGPYWQPEVWLLRKLAADGYRIEYRGRFLSSYESSDLWLVTR